MRTTNINMKKLWEVINKVTGKVRNKNDIIDSLKIDQEITKEPIRIANEFGQYFSTIGKKFAEKTPKPDKNIDEYIKKISGNDKSLFLYSYTVDSGDNVGGWGYEINIFSHFGPDLI